MSDLSKRLRELEGRFDIAPDLHGEAADEIEAVENEKARICRAVGHYAHHAPLDLKKPSEIQRDLMAICGEPHVHIASIDSDTCDLCGHDLRHEIHSAAKREAKKSADRPGAALSPIFR